MLYVRNFYIGLVAWMIIWIVTLNLHPGSKSIPTQYRFNFLHGLCSSVMAFLCLYNFVPDYLTTTCTISYFLVDLTNMLLNDFVFKVESYQKKTARKMEYIHHIFCLLVGVVSEVYYLRFCSFDHNPFVKLMFAEIPTPFLMLWRQTKHIYYGYCFYFLFILSRLIYHGLYLIPNCIQSCHYTVGYGFGIPYNMMNTFFFYMITRKLFYDHDSNKLM
jgi:hypothetical protein